MICSCCCQTVRLEWDRPKSAELAGCPISRYTVRLRPDGAHRSRTWKVDGDRRSVTLYGLDPAASYHVRVLAVVCHGKGKPSPWLGVRTARSVTVDDTGMHSEQPINDQQGRLPIDHATTGSKPFSNAVVIYISHNTCYTVLDFNTARHVLCYGVMQLLKAFVF